jgi:hypothetical protein
MKIVIFKENGVFKTTTDKNYNREIRNAREIFVMKNFTSANEIMSYFITNFGNRYTEESFIVVNGGFTDGNFLDDEEKMKDFYELTKEEFLTSYSYLTEEEYDNTAKLVKKEKEAKEIMNHYDEGCRKWSQLLQR